MNLQVPLCLIIVLASVASQREAKNGCSGPVIKINNAYYIRENLKKNIYHVDSMSFDNSTNTLYLCFIADQSINKVVPAKINLNTNEFQIIDGIQNARFIFVDKKSNEVYIAGRTAIYKYDKDGNKVEPFVARHFNAYPNFNMLYATNTLYFSGFPSYVVYKAENGEVTKFKDLETTQVRNLVIDEDDNIFFTNNTGFFKQKKGGDEAIQYEELEDFELMGLTIDNLGDIYVNSGDYGLSVLKKRTNKIVKVFEDVTRAVTFDGDNNMIYSDDDNVYRLRPNTDPRYI